MTRRLLSLPIKGEGKAPLAVDVLHDESGRLFFVADLDVDCDGSGGNPYNDPYFQPDTSYHYQGNALNPYKVPFIVLPKSVINAVKPVVLGCKARITNTKTGVSCDCIVGDVGPPQKLGEASCLAAELIGFDPSPIDGGADSYDAVLYEVWPGFTTTIDGITYPLQPS